MKELITRLFGAYTPIASTEVLPSGETIETVVSGAAGIDWAWLAGVVLFTVCLWSVFRLIGVVLHG